ncbi:hypothetical protein [Streptomyces cadmiisoli]|uniref:hypothetical protein n=1 Tax=Streptomyces cadmiisoli TaxID=2184053 RepID=UPI003D74DB93
MHEKPLSKIAAELLHLHPPGSHPSADRSAPTGFALDPVAVSEFVADRLDAPGEAALADQVARLVPFHWSLPNTIAAELSQVTDHVGGQPELLAWLDRYPGMPRLTARLYVLMGLLDQYSSDDAVVTALREFRQRTPYPEGLRGYLVPETDDETLGSLAYRIEEELGDGRTHESVELALATEQWLRQVAPRAEELDPRLGDMDELLGHTREDIRSAAAET